MKIETTNPYCFTYKTEELQIELLGGVRIDGLDRMRVTIKVTVVNRKHKEYLNNGVDLYRGKEGFMKPLLGLPVSVVNLYFFEGSLITAYIHLGENPENIELVGKTLEHSIKRQGKALKLRSGNGYKWEDDTSTLALIQDIRKGRFVSTP